MLLFLLGMGKHKGLKIFLILIAFLLLLCMFYIAYDRSLTPPPPQWTSPPFTPDPPGIPQVPWLSWGKGTNYYLNFLATHRPNALEHYINALSMATEGDYFVDIMDKGWTQPNLGAEKEILLNQPAVQELIAGTQMKHCELSPMPYHKDAPSINFLQCRVASYELVLSARFDEWDHQYSSAMQKYLYGIQFGTDLEQKDQSMITHMIGLALLGEPTQCLLQLISKDILKEKDYRLIISEIQRLEPQIIPLSNTMETEYRLVRTVCQSGNPFYEYSYTSTFNDSLFYLTSGQFSDAISAIKPLHDQASYDLSMFFRRGQNLKEFDQFYNELLSASTTKSYREFVKTDWKTKAQQSNSILVQMSLQYYSSAYKQHMIKLTYLRLAQIQSAIHLYHLKKKKWPKSLDDLKPDYLKTIPLDPFVDQPFHISQDSTGVFAYSIGPDFKDDQAKISYAPYTNQNDSGDIRP